MMAEVRVPIACSLTADDAKDRITEWRQVLATDIDEVEVRVEASAARLRLRAGDSVLLRVVDLAEREQACCPFFGFRVELAGGQRWLHVSVPDDARPILADLVSLLPAAAGDSAAPDR
jgi:MerR family copper efflux transcriptional regulator